MLTFSRASDARTMVSGGAGKEQQDDGADCRPLKVGWAELC